MPKPHLRVGSIHVIESLPPGDLRTGERLFEDLEPWAHSMHQEFECHFWRERTSEDFLARLEAIVDDVRRSGRSPILHIEAHGADDETGLVLSSGDFVPWSALKGPLTKINITCRLNLLVNLSACNGRGLLEIIQATDRAPVWGLLGPNRSLCAGEVEAANRAFYKTFFATRDGDEGWRAMNAAISKESRTYSFFGAQPVFRYVLSNYFAELCSDQSIAERKARIIETLLADGLSPTIVRASGAALSQYITDHQARFSDAKRHFFFVDLCPDHAERFPISLQDCLGP